YFKKFGVPEPGSWIRSRRPFRSFVYQTDATRLPLDTESAIASRSPLPPGLSIPLSEAFSS
ncbi:MAG: hypothetical protein ACYDBP_15245, partial [Leptospirales bacterium]